MTAARSAVDRSAITGLVLAGGRGQRMGGVDKGLQDFGGQPLALHAARRLAPQVGSLLINANRHLATYEAFGFPVHADRLPDFAGPLAGLSAGLAHCRTPWLLSVPCDAPLFPSDLAARLAAALQAAGADIAVASAPELQPDGHTMLRVQPVFCLLRADLLGSLDTFIAEGGRRVRGWMAQHHTVEVPFDQPDDAPNAFANANSLAELAALNPPPP